MKSIALLCAVIVGFLTGASAPVKKSKSDKELLQGEWTVVKAEENGRDLEDVLKASMIFKDDKVTVKREKVNEKTGPFKLDPEKKLKEMDLTIVEENRKALCIYMLDGDKLTICLSERPDSIRPTEFKSGPGVILLELTRVKKE